MKLLACLVAFGLSLSPFVAPAQTGRAPSHKPPAFSGTWILNLTRSKFLGPSPEGSSVMIINYDGNTWKCTQKHLNPRGQAEATWKVKLIVDSPNFHVEKGVPFTFRTRIARRAQAMVMVEHLSTPRGERTTNSTRFTLAEDGNTLIEDVTSSGPLGLQTNHLVLERQSSGEPASTAANKPAD